MVKNASSASMKVPPKRKGNERLSETHTSHTLPQ